MTDETLPEPDGYIYDAAQKAQFDFYTAATLRQAVKRARREALEEARRVVLSEVLHLEVVNCEEDVAYNTAINDAQNAIRKLMEDEQ